ncbi:MAG: xanthine dehydrogenase small subunit [Alphaproteobacteria bacterium]
MTDTIRFILNGKFCEVSDLPPTMTLLQYLRGPARLCGTKEGCAEGDCGACTVMVARLEADGSAPYRSINACIALLPSLDGRQIVTVEHLRTVAGGDLHPVQQSMVNCHASQCGFCTPGFVMAIATELNNSPAPDDTALQDAIAGNLCRCTGYRPILDAARHAAGAPRVAIPSDAAALGGLQRGKMFAYETADGKFFAPVTPAELADVLAQYPDAYMLSGGTDVGLWVTKFHMRLPVIVYTGNITALRNLHETDAGLEIGAAVTYSEAFAALARQGAGMEDLLRRLGSAHIRNAGTLGGNIANGSPIGDGPPPLIALGAEIVLRGKDGTRRLPLEKYFLAYKKQDRKPGEFLEKIIVPKPAENTLFATYKVSKRFDQDISAVCAGFALDMDGHIIRAARLCYGGMAATPKRAAAAEAALIGKPWSRDALDAAMAAMDSDFTPLSDMRASAEYRQRVAKNLLKRFFIETTQPDVKTEVYRHAG